MRSWFEDYELNLKIHRHGTGIPSQALAARMQQGYAIYDIGLDPDPYREIRGFFYFLETGLMNASRYPYWVQIKGIQ